MVLRDGGGWRCGGPGDLFQLLLLLGDCHSFCDAITASNGVWSDGSGRKHPRVNGPEPPTSAVSVAHVALV